MSDCSAEIAKLSDKIDRIDEAIRGNGHPGLKQRIDRLEQIETDRSKVKWMIVTAMFSGIGSLAILVIQLAFK